MSATPLVFLSQDEGLIEHWKRSFRTKKAVCVDSFAALSKSPFPVDAVALIDQAVRGLPAASDGSWALLTAQKRLVFCSSRPTRDEGIQALGSGFAGYCHAYADAHTLRQVILAVGSGQVWVGRDIMRDLLTGVRLGAPVAAVPSSGWSVGLTERERKVAGLAANGSANREIAEQCGITERTVKAHLAGVFTKLGVVDRLQLALRVHGIR